MRNKTKVTCTRISVPAILPMVNDHDICGPRTIAPAPHLGAALFWGSRACIISDRVPGTALVSSAKRPAGARFTGLTELAQEFSRPLGRPKKGDRADILVQ